MSKEGTALRTGMDRWLVLAATVAVGWAAAEVRAQCSSWSVTNISQAADGHFFGEGSDVVIDADGYFHIIGMDWGWCGDCNTKVTYFTNRTGSWTAENLYVYGGTNRKPMYTFIKLTPDDMLHVFYKPVSGMDITWRTKPVSGGSWSSPVEVADGFVDEVVVDDAGGMCMMTTWLFRDYDDISDPYDRSASWSRYKPLSGGWGSSYRIVGTDHADYWFQGGEIALHPDGQTFWATYEGEEPWNDTIYLKTWAPGDTQWSPSGGDGRGAPFPDSRIPGAPVIASNPTSNEMVAAWTQSDGGDEHDRYFEVYVKFSQDGGVTWGQAHNFSDANGLDRSPRIAFDEVGNCFVAWTYGADGAHTSHSDLRARIGGAWGPKINITSGYEASPFGIEAKNGVAAVTSFADSGPGIQAYFDLILSTCDYSNYSSGKGTLTGVVRDQYGAPVQYAYVAASSYFAETDANGEYTMLLPAGTYQNVTGYREYYSSTVVSNVTVTAGQTTNQDLVITGQPTGVAYFTSVEGSPGTIELEWNNPSNPHYTGTMIRYRTDGVNPTSPTDGFLLLDRNGSPGSTDSFTHSNLTNGLTYAYTNYTYYEHASRYYGPPYYASATPHVQPDFDEDGDVDHDDFGILQSCLTGQAVPQTDPDCLDARLDFDNTPTGDTDVDLNDVNIFLGCALGADIVINDESCLP